MRDCHASHLCVQIVRSEYNTRGKGDQEKMNIGSKEEIFETWLSLCPPPPKESPASANLSLQERPSSSDDEEILQEVVKVGGDIKSKIKRSQRLRL